jgi:hypothetical protein
MDDPCDKAEGEKTKSGKGDSYERDGQNTPAKHIAPRTGTQHAQPNASSHINGADWK